MNTIRKEKHIFKKGETYHLDQVYLLMGLMPEDSDNPYYHQDDISDFNKNESDRIMGLSTYENSAGEYIQILRNFSISFSIKG